MQHMCVPPGNAQGDCSHKANKRTARLQMAPARPAGATPLALIKVMFSQKIARLAIRYDF